MFTRNSLWNIAGGAVPALSALVAIPILISSLGYELFSINSLIISLTIFFFVYDFGVGRATTFFIAKSEHANKDREAELIGTSLFFALILGIFTTLTVYVFVPYVVKNWIKIRPEVAGLAIQAFQITALGIMPSVISNTLKGILEGKAEFRLANICKMFSGASIFLAPLLIVLFGSKSLTQISTVIVASRYITLMLYLYYVIQIFNLSGIQLKLSTFQMLYKYGVWAALSGFISTMFVYGDRFIVARYLAPESLSIYVASQDILIRYLLIPWSMAIVLMPIFSAGNLSKIESSRLYQQRQKSMCKLSLGVCMFIILIALVGIQFLEGFGIPLFARDIVIIQAVGVFFCSISQLPLIYLYAHGMPRLVTMIYSIEALIYIVVAPQIFSHYAITGACLVWSGRLVLEYLLLDLFAKRLMN